MKRREFIKTTAAASLAAAMPRIPEAYAAGSDAIRVGVVGCGGRGTGAAIDCLNSSAGVEVVAMFEGRGTGKDQSSRLAVLKPLVVHIPEPEARK